MNEHLTRREALVAALAATALGGQALARPRAARAATAVNIGVILPLSHPGDSVARQQHPQSARLWADWVNGHGGVNGRQVTLKIYDSKADPDRGTKNLVNAVTKDGCAVILAGWDSTSPWPRSRWRTSTACRSSSPTRGLPTSRRRAIPEVVRIGPNNDMLANAFAPFMAKQKYGHVAVISEDTAFGKGLGEAIRATATLAGIDMASGTTSAIRTTCDPRSGRCCRRSPTRSWSRRTPRPRSTWASRRRAQPATRATSCSAGITSTRLLEGHRQARRGRHLADLLGTPQAFTSAGLTFKHLFTKKYKHAPLVYQAFTWDELNAWKWAAETAGSIAPADVDPRAAAHRHAGHAGPHHALGQAGHGPLQPVGRRHGLLRPGHQEGRDGRHRQADRDHQGTLPVGSRPMPHRSLWLDEALSPDEPAAPRSRALHAPTSRSWAAATPASGLRSASSSASPRAMSSCSSRTSAAAARAAATAASRSPGGPSSARSSSCAAPRARSRWRMPARQAVDEIGAFCDEHGIDAHYHRGGHLWTTTSQAQHGAWDGVMATCRELGVMPFEEWTTEETVRRSGTDRHLAGLFEPSAAVVQPARLVRGLRRVALELGVRIHEGTRVTKLDRRTPACCTRRAASSPPIASSSRPTPGRSGCASCTRASRSSRATSSRPCRCPTGWRRSAGRGTSASATRG